MCQYNLEFFPVGKGYVINGAHLVYMNYKTKNSFSSTPITAWNPWTCLPATGTILFHFRSLLLRLCILPLLCGAIFFR